MPFYYADSVEIPAPVGYERGDAVVAPATDPNVTTSVPNSARGPPSTFDIQCVDLKVAYLIAS